MAVNFSWSTISRPSCLPTDSELDGPGVLQSTRIDFARSLCTHGSRQRMSFRQRLTFHSGLCEDRVYKATLVRGSRVFESSGIAHGLAPSLLFDVRYQDGEHNCGKCTIMQTPLLMSYDSRLRIRKCA